MSRQPRGTGVGYRVTGDGARVSGTGPTRAGTATRRATTPGEGETADRRNGARRSGGDAVWRARVDQRLSGVEDAICDLRTRVNSVLALIGAAVVGQIALRFFGH
jgi:hypothetical protein